MSELDNESWIREIGGFKIIPPSMEMSFTGPLCPYCKTGPHPGQCPNCGAGKQACRSQVDASFFGRPVIDDYIMRIGEASAHTGTTLHPKTNLSVE
jgi:hypothetical protein